MPLQLLPPAEALARILEVLRDAVSSIPTSTGRPGSSQSWQAQRLWRMASLKAAAVSGTLSIPPGPAGLLTLLPDLVLIWRIQGQMVSDIAASYGKEAYLTREGLLHCLFKHTAAQAVRGMVICVGGGMLIRRASADVLDTVLRRVSMSLAQRVAAKAVSRWLPVLGAVGVGAYAYYDTRQIAKTAVEMFESEVVLGN